MPKTIETKYLGNYKSGTKTPLNTEPVTVAATQFTPVDLLVSAYGSCLLGTMDFEARKKQFEIADARAEITVEMSDDKTRVGRLSAKILLGSSYTNEQKEIIEQGAKFKCHVGNSLDKSIDRQYEFVYNG
jgi:uncharacterized OsmC-like protein